ncbi:MAG: hypothetical protein M1818_006273 [Claussenomyces sp. TS43310]|nr:MAG: hypothetical protein M1818_006273 [Claussenomyces sp. TS43310]
MDSSDSIALSALIIAVLALFIAVFQSLLTSYVTAEGAKRCRESIIGKWAGLTKWHWIWSELRYEIKFTTPEIILVDVAEQARLHQEACALDDEKTELTPASSTDQQGQDVFYYSRDEIHKPKEWQSKLHILGFDTIPGAIEQKWKDNKQIIVGTEIGFLNRFKGYIKHKLHLQTTFDRALMVTWDDFLRLAFIYQTYSQRLRRDVTRYTSSSEDPSHLTTDPFLELTGESFIAIRLRQQTWDSMPPDIVRPIARTTLGSVLVLAQRLGLRWVSLTKRPYEFLAEGDGCDISSTIVPALGTILRFNLRTNQRPLQIVNNTHADKMLCGIIPGCEDLELPDFPITAEDGSKDEGLANMFRTFGFCHAARLLYKKPLEMYWRRLFMNDLIALVCPFMTSKHSPNVGILYPLAWRIPAPWEHGGAGYALTPFHFWEGRKIYHLRLSQCVRSYQEQSAHASPSLIQALELFNRMAEFKADFYHSRVSKPACISVQSLTPDPGKKKEYEVETARERAIQRGETANMLENLSSVFDATTRWFKARNRTTQSADDDSDTTVERDPSSPPTLKYVDLLRAHIDMEAQTLNEIVGGRASGGRKKWPVRSEDENFLEQILAGFDEGRRGPHTNWPIITFALEFVRGRYRVLNDLKSMGYGTNAGYERDQKELEAAWWMLMVRGVCWRMSVAILRPNSRAMVPSSLYNSQMPVWLA